MTMMKHAVITYSDYLDRPTRLSDEELAWFYSQVDLAKRATGCTVEILPYDHDLYDREDQDALGCCISDNPKNPLAVTADTYITIDCFYINECWRHETNGDFLISRLTMPEVLAHEIAHLYVWRHGKNHTRKTVELLKQILEFARKEQAA